MRTGWKQQKLGNVCDFLNRGISPKYLNDGGVCVLNQKCVRDHTVNYEPSRRHDAKAKIVSKERFVRVGDVLVNSTGTGTLGRVAQVREEPDEPTTVDSHVTIVRPKPGMFHLDFFGYMLVVIEDAIKEAGEGCGGQTELARSVLADRFSVSYPTALPEQHRIVGILDEAFDGLATAMANAEQNLRNARALFESHLQAVFNKRGDGWVEKQLGDIAEFKNGLNFTRQSKGQTLRMVGVGDFQDNSVVPTGSLQSVTIDGELPDDYLIRRDDILTVRSNGSKDLVGRCMLVPDVDGMTSYSGFIIRIRFDTSQISPRFLLRFMKSSQTRERLTRDGGGANISNINQAKLSELPISLPSFSQQEDIANRLDAIAAETQRLEAIYQQKLAALGELKKSLLHQAFSGAL